LDWRNVGGSRISAAFWGKNLFDVDYLASGTELANTGLGYTAAFAGTPRTYGAELRFAF
jgi:iron complex outermembrane receptor protein